MFSISKIKLCMLVWLVCITLIFINITPVTAQAAQETKSGSPAPSCIPCDVPTCPPCDKNSKCTLSLRTCFQCPKATCTKLSSDDNDNSGNNNQGNKILLPAVIGGILGVGLLTAIGYIFFVWRRRTRNNRGIKLDSNDEMTSLNGENVIPIAYIPSTTPTTPTTPIPEPSYLRIRVSSVSAGTTPLASPLPRNLRDEQLLIDITDDDDTAPDIGTILQATKTSPAASTATLVTATRAKPALVRLNTIKQTNKEMSSTQSTKSENSNPSTPRTPMKNNTFLNALSTSSVPNSPTSIRIGGDSDTDQMMPHIDIERSSAESFRVTNPSQNITSHNKNLNSAALDPIEGRQSFGLFGSDEVFSNDPSSPQLHRESIISSSSSNGRSTMFSDDGDGEIMIFWGGNTPGGEGQIQVKKHENNVDSTKKHQNEAIKTKESI